MRPEQYEHGMLLMAFSRLRLAFERQQAGIAGSPPISWGLGRHADQHLVACRRDMLAGSHTSGIQDSSGA